MPVSQPVQAATLGDYIKTLDANTIVKLYAKSSACCLAVFEQLPSLAKQYVIRLLFLDRAIPKEVISSWVANSIQEEHGEISDLLTTLKIWSEYPIHGSLPGLKLHDTFRNNLQVALLGGGDPWIIKACDDRDKHARDVAFLDSYAMERWECILHFMVGSLQDNEVVSKDTVDILVHGGLINYDTSTKELPTITASGFKFLLMDTKSQVWYFLLQYLDTVDKKNLDLVECLTFLFQLSFLTLGKDYSTTSLSESMLSFLQHLREFGLIYQRKRKDGRFYPTKLVVNLTAPKNSMDTDTKEDRFIVIETNYRVYAYTSSPLQMALVALFTEMQYRMQNVGIGILTRESVRQALKNGITAEQIINFLKVHAHPQLIKTPNIIAPTVVDQIKLWEIERDRFLFKEGVLYSQFLSQNDFQLLKKYAEDAGHLIWDNPSKRVMVVSVEGHDDVRRFWKRHKKDH